MPLPVATSPVLAAFCAPLRLDPHPALDVSPAAEMVRLLRLADFVARVVAADLLDHVRVGGEVLRRAAPVRDVESARVVYELLYRLTDGPKQSARAWERTIEHAAACVLAPMHVARRGTRPLIEFAAHGGEAVLTLPYEELYSRAARGSRTLVRELCGAPVEEGAVAE